MALAKVTVPRPKAEFECGSWDESSPGSATSGPEGQSHVCNGGQHMCVWDGGQHMCVWGGGQYMCVCDGSRSNSQVQASKWIHRFKKEFRRNL